MPDLPENADPRLVDLVGQYAHAVAALWQHADDAHRAHAVPFGPVPSDGCNRQPCLLVRNVILGGGHG
jgi:hypothetical protein